MTEPERKLNRYKRGIEIEHRFGVNEDYGDFTLDAEGYDDSFGLYFDRCKGLNRDNYRASADGEIKLNTDEARELLLLLTVWLEGQGVPTTKES